jgi:hypothetical protein
MKSTIIIGIIYLVAIFGWGRCIYKFASCDFENGKSWKAEIIYGIGTFTGAGAVIGYMDFGK